MQSDVGGIVRACDTNMKAWDWARRTNRHIELQNMFRQVQNRLSTEFGQQLLTEDIKIVGKRYSAEAFVVESAGWADMASEATKEIQNEIVKIRDLHKIENHFA